MCLVPHSDLMETGAVALAVELVALFGLITWRIIVGRKRRAEILADVGEAVRSLEDMVDSGALDVGPSASHSCAEVDDKAVGTQRPRP